jgi:hypothetical protein
LPASSLPVIVAAAGGASDKLPVQAGSASDNLLISKVYCKGAGQA